MIKIKDYEITINEEKSPLSCYNRLHEYKIGAKEITPEFCKDILSATDNPKVTREIIELIKQKTDKNLVEYAKYRPLLIGSILNRKEQKSVLEKMRDLIDVVNEKNSRLNTEDYLLTSLVYAGLKISLPTYLQNQDIDKRDIKNIENYLLEQKVYQEQTKILQEAQKKAAEGKIFNLKQTNNTERGYLGHQNLEDYSKLEINDIKILTIDNCQNIPQANNIDSSKLELLNIEQTDLNGLVLRLPESITDISFKDVTHFSKKCILIYKILIWILLLFSISILLFYPQNHIPISFICSLLLLSHIGFIGEYILLYWNREWNDLKQKGILVRGIEPLDLLSRMKHIIFDLEHTLTYGRDMVAKIVNHTRYSDEELLYYVACAEEYSINPIALAIKNSYGKRIHTSVLSNYQELSGLGVKVNVEKQTVLVGNEKLLTKFGVWVEEPEKEIGTVLHIAIDQEYAGYIVVRDELKADAITWLQQCRKSGFHHIKVISSESENFVTMVCKKLEISNYLSHLSLLDKNRALERYRFEEKKGFVLVSNHEKLLADHHADLNIMMKNIDDDFCHDAEILICNGNDLGIVKKTANRLRKRSWMGVILFLFTQFCLLCLLFIGYLPVYFIPITKFIFDNLFILFYRKGA